MTKAGYIHWIQRIQFMYPNHCFKSYAPNIRLSRLTTNFSHKEERIWPILRINASFTGTKYIISAQSSGTLRLIPSASNQAQGPSSTAYSWPPSWRTSTIKNRINASYSTHRPSFFQTMRMWKSQSHSTTRGRKPIRRTSPNFLTRCWRNLRIPNTSLSQIKNSWQQKNPNRNS